MVGIERLRKNNDRKRRRSVDVGIPRRIAMWVCLWVTKGIRKQKRGKRCRYEQGKKEKKEGGWTVGWFLSWSIGKE